MRPCRLLWLRFAVAFVGMPYECGRIRLRPWWFRAAFGRANGLRGCRGCRGRGDAQPGPRSACATAVEVIIRCSNTAVGLQSDNHRLLDRVVPTLDGDLSSPL